jgi:hypothetical protein
MSSKIKIPKCQVAMCENEATCRCAESKLRYCNTHKHAHKMDDEHVHHYEKLPEYWNAILKKKR